MQCLPAPLVGQDSMMNLSRGWGKKRPRQAVNACAPVLLCVAAGVATLVPRSASEAACCRPGAGAVAAAAAGRSLLLPGRAPHHVVFCCIFRERGRRSGAVVHAAHQPWLRGSAARPRRHASADFAQVFLRPARLRAVRGHHGPARVLPYAYRNGLVAAARRRHRAQRRPLPQPDRAGGGQLRESARAAGGLAAPVLCRRGHCR
ncbi:hypothetical protein D3C78_1380370 [compost metagenome]